MIHLNETTDALNTCVLNTCLTMVRALTAGGVTRERWVLCACTHLRMNSGSVIPGKRAKTPNEPYRRTHVCKRRPPRESMAGDCPEPRCFALDKWVNGASLKEMRWPVRHGAVDLPTFSPSVCRSLSLSLSVYLSSYRGFFKDRYRTTHHVTKEFDARGSLSSSLTHKFTHTHCPNVK